MDNFSIYVEKMNDIL